MIEKCSINCICVTCGKEFRLGASRVKYGRGKNCSKQCFRSYIGKTLTGRKGLSRRGEENPNWKGRRAAKECPICKTVFSSPNQTCSVACGHVIRSGKISGENNPYLRNNPPPRKTCKRCEKVFWRQKSSGAGMHYCSDECRVRNSHMSLRAVSIANRLSKKGYELILEKSWSWLKSPHSKQRLRIDIFIKSHNIAIEYDGKQHREAAFAKGEDGLRRIQERDAAKETLLRQNGIHLIRLSDWPIDIKELSSRIEALC